MPWNDHLYLVSYLSVPDGGNGTGLYRIDANLNVGSVDNRNFEDQLFQMCIDRTMVYVVI